MTKEVPSWLFVSKSSGFFLIFIKLSSYSNLITHMFFISLHVDHFNTPFINRPTTCCFLYPPCKMETFIQLDCFCRYTTVTVVPSLSFDDNLVIEISEVVCKRKVPNNKWGGRGGVLISGVGQKFE